MHIAFLDSTGTAYQGIIRMTTDLRLSSPDTITVYGYDWCRDTTRARDHFDAAGVGYAYVNYEVDPAAKELVHGAGYGSTPVVITPQGALFMEPSDEELAGIVAAAAG
jgi:mycoredoxin